jgi:hypothetical protein
MIMKEEYDHTPPICFMGYPHHTTRNRLMGGHTVGFNFMGYSATTVGEKKMRKKSRRDLPNIYTVHKTIRNVLQAYGMSRITSVPIEMLILKELERIARDNELANANGTASSQPS